MTKTKLALLIGALVSILCSITAGAAIIPITGDAAWGSDVEYLVEISGPRLTFNMYTCDAPEFTAWNGPFTFTAHGYGSECTEPETSSSAGPYAWTISDGDTIDATVTGVPGPCGTMVVNPEFADLWSETCAVKVSGSFNAYPRGTPGPSLFGTLMGVGSVTYNGVVSSDGFVQTTYHYGASFIGIADITSPKVSDAAGGAPPEASPAPEPPELLLLLSGIAGIVISYKLSPRPA